MTRDVPVPFTLLSDVPAFRRPGVWRGLCVAYSSQVRSGQVRSQLTAAFRRPGQAERELGHGAWNLVDDGRPSTKLITAVYKANRQDKTSDEVDLSASVLPMHNEITALCT